jgi:hypothetical protein
MVRKEIPRDEWREFLQAFGARHRGWLTSVEQGRVRISDRPLAGVELRLAGGEIEAILLRFGNGMGAIQVNAPRAVRVEETLRGEETGLDLEAADGLTRLSFRTTALPEQLDGLAPSERS